MGRAVLTLVIVWSCIVIVTPLTEQEVYRATQYIQNNLNANSQRQFAYVAVFSKKECDSLSSNNNNLQILTNEDATEIANALNNENIYEGSQMVLATYKSKGDGKPYNIHSEYRLMFPTGNLQVSPAQNLLNRNPGATCAIFYTLNSPCVVLCANTEHSNNIIQQLTIFNTFGSNKAFVYNKLYNSDINSKKHDAKEKIWKGLNDINNNMNVYRCIPSKCLNCFLIEKNNLTNKNDCLISKKSTDK